MPKNTRRWLVICVVASIITLILILSLKLTSRNLQLQNGQIVRVEIASSSFTRAKGLMYRKHLSENSGMLFIFDYSAKHIFWMKNTLIPLDMIWIDENFKIIDITKNVPPCETESCQTYMPAFPAKYVLEVDGGYSEKQNIKIGDTLKLE